MAAELPLPKQILAHAHWTMGKQKMSKSRGNVADPLQVLKDYGVDTVRYYLVRDGGLADDGGKNNHLDTLYGSNSLSLSCFIRLF
jgi:methionyl-tRNA synthetase